MQLWQHPNGVHYVLYGPRLQRRISTRTTDVRKAEQFLAQCILGEQNKFVEQPTLNDIFDRYEPEAASRVRSKDTLKYAIAALRPRIGHLRPRDLTPPTIRKYAKERGTGPANILRELAVLRSAISWAVANKWITAEERPVISSPVAAPPPRDVWVTKEQARILLPECRELHLKLFVLLGLMTVARTAAILGLKWDKVDFDRRLIDYGTGFGNKRRAVVPINDMLYGYLVMAKKMAVTDYVIELHGRPVKYVKKGFKAACDRAGLVGISPHILRHSGATWMAEDGVPLKEIARMLADTEATVERVYIKHTPGYLKSAANALQFDDAA